MTNKGGLPSFHLKTFAPIFQKSFCSLTLASFFFFFIGQMLQGEPSFLTWLRKMSCFLCWCDSITPLLTVNDTSSIYIFPPPQGKGIQSDYQHPIPDSFSLASVTKPLLKEKSNEIISHSIFLGLYPFFFFFGIFSTTTTTFWFWFNLLPPWPTHLATYPEMISCLPSTWFVVESTKEFKLMTLSMLHPQNMKPKKIKTESLKHCSSEHVQLKTNHDSSSSDSSKSSSGTDPDRASKHSDPSVKHDF